MSIVRFALVSVAGLVLMSCDGGLDRSDAEASQGFTEEGFTEEGFTEEGFTEEGFTEGSDNYAIELGTIEQALVRPIPQRIEAEAFERFSDTTVAQEGSTTCSTGPVDQEPTLDTNGGGCNIGYTRAGEWLEYDISSDTARSVNIVLRVASAQTGRTVRVSLRGQSVGTITSPSGGWQAWANRSVNNVAIPQGNSVLRLDFETGSVNLNYLDIMTVPGRVEAEQFTRFWDSDVKHNGDCGSGALDQQVTTDIGGGCNIGYTAPGEWVDYDFNLATATTFNLTARLASALTARTVSLSRNLDGGNWVNLGTVTSPSAGWQAFQNRTLSNLSFPAGNTTVRVSFNTGSVNMNYLDFIPVVQATCSDGLKNGAETDVDCGGATCSDCANGRACLANTDCQSNRCVSSVCQADATPRVTVPALIQAESYVRFNELTAGNQGAASSPACSRGDSVDIQTTTDVGGGCNIGWTSSGEWLEYDLRVASQARYNVVLRLASRVPAAGSSTSRVHFELTRNGNVMNSGAIFTPGLGFQSWDDRTITGLDLVAGDYVLRVAFDVGETNFNHVNFVLSAGQDQDGDRLADSVETNTGIFVGAGNTGTSPTNPDTDGDGISDGDEVLGTLQNLNLPAMGVNPLRKDILLEYDWFDDGLECGSHSHRPTSNAISRLTAAFSSAPVPNPDGSTGITLINDYGQGGVFTGGTVIPDADGVLSGNVFGTEYLDYKASRLAANRNDYFHYVLLPHRYDTNSASSGYAEIVGDAMIVSLYCSNSDVNVSNTIMHELGHNLGLRHGGDEDMNFKPNYNSVMNYSFQFPGADNDCDPFGDGVLDFSRGTRINLNEALLDERLGTCGNTISPARPYDWNGNGSIQSSLISFDMHPSGGDGVLRTLVDYDDWAGIDYNWRAAGAGGAVAPVGIECNNPAPAP